MASIQPLDAVGFWSPWSYHNIHQITGSTFSQCPDIPTHEIPMHIQQRTSTLQHKLAGLLELASHNRLKAKYIMMIVHVFLSLCEGKSPEKFDRLRRFCAGSAQVTAQHPMVNFAANHSSYYGGHSIQYGLCQWLDQVATGSTSLGWKD